MKRRPFVALLLAPLLAEPTTAAAEEDGAEILRGLGVEQRLDAQVPPELTFTDAAGEPVRLRDYFGSRPLVLSLVYYECPMLCTLILNGLLRALRACSLDVGRDFEVITLSFDPGETFELAAAKKRSYLEKYRRPGAAAGWHFLTGEEQQIKKLADAVGFRYDYDPKTDEYAHASALVILTPDGRVARYLFGVEYPPRDLRLGLVEAGQGEIGTAVDQLLLYCFRYDPSKGKYSLLVFRILRLAGAVTVGGIALLVAGLLVRERRKRMSFATGTQEVS